MKIVCDACQAKYSIADDKIQGKAFKIRCKKCSHVIVVKLGGETAAAPASGAAPAPVASESSKPSPTEQGVWHVVVEGEQVGPLTEAGVKELLSQGKINSDTLVWKDGMGDWTALSTVPELAAVFANVAHHSPAKPAAYSPARKSASMKAAVPAAEAAASGAMAAGEDDVFAAPTVVTASGAAAFMAAASPAQAATTAAPAHSVEAHPAQVAPAPAPSSAFLFGGSPAQAPEQVVVRNPGNGAGGTHLTGQRNENSVLFSLSNLEALAVPSHSAGVRAPSGSSNTEGSGLIDIRSMAAMTLGESGDARRSVDALPTFSTPQFSPVAPVLLPMSTSGPPKWVYPILGLLAIGIAAIGYGIYKVSTAPAPGAAPTMQPVVAPVVPIASPQPVTQPPAVVPTPSVQSAPEAAKPAPAEGHAASEEKPADRGKAGKGDKGHHKGGESRGESRGSSESKKGSEVAAAPTTPPSAPATDASKSGASKPAAKKGGRSLDDLLGEVGTKRSGEEGSSRPAAAAASAKLISLTQSDIVGAMKGVQPKVQACANQFKVPGTAMAQLSVASGGRVSSASVTGKFAGTPTGSCVEAAAKSAKFPPCQSMSFPWPFTLSPR